MMREPVLPSSSPTAAASFTFSYSAALLGHAYHPSGAYQSYATWRLGLAPRRLRLLVRQGASGR